MYIFLSISLYFDLRRLLGGSGKEVWGGPFRRGSKTEGWEILRDLYIPPKSVFS